MKKLVSIVLAALLVACAHVSPFHELRSVTAPIIFNDQVICSGVMVAPRLMVTAAHCMIEGVDLKVNGQSIKLLRKSEADDIAVIRVEMGCPCAPVAHNEAYLDEPVVVVGFPMNEIFRVQSVTEGRAEGIEELNGGEVKLTPKLRITAPIAPGNSGGGVFAYRNGQWFLVGIVSAMTNRCNGFTCTPIHHLGYAATAQSINRLLDFRNS